MSAPRLRLCKEGGAASGRLPHPQTYEWVLVSNMATEIRLYSVASPNGFEGFDHDVRADPAAVRRVGWVWTEVRRPLIAQD